jgi:hypothetical protein
VAEPERLDLGDTRTIVLTWLRQPPGEAKPGPIGLGNFILPFVKSPYLASHTGQPIL